MKLSKIVLPVIIVFGVVVFQSFCCSRNSQAIVLNLVTQKNLQKQVLILKYHLFKTLFI